MQRNVAIALNRKCLALGLVMALLSMCVLPVGVGAWRIAYGSSSAEHSGPRDRELCTSSSVQELCIFQGPAHAKLRLLSSASRFMLDRSASTASALEPALSAGRLVDQRDSIRRVCRRQHAPPGTDAEAA